MGIEFPLERARRAMELLQIQPSLLEDSGRQIFPARLELVLVSSHFDLVCYFLLKRSKIEISQNLRFLRSEVVSVLARSGFCDDCPIKTPP